MKRRIKILLILLIMLPMLVSAKSYDEAVNQANGLLTSSYPTYNDYLLYDNLPFVYNKTTGKYEVSNTFKHGGFLNINEYIISLPKSNNTSYLSIGEEFFLTERGYAIAGSSANAKYNNKNIKGLKNGVSDASVRVTEFVKPKTQVTGSGTMTNPWIFTSNFNLTIEFDKDRMNSLEVKKDSSTTVYTPDSINQENNLEKNCSHNVCSLDLGRYKVNCDGAECGVKLKIDPKGEYRYAYNTCGGKIVGDYLVINNLIKDTKCKIMFGNGTYKVKIGKYPTGIDSKTSPKEVYLKYGENYYTDNEFTKIVSVLEKLPDFREGYTFDGYYYNEIQIIDSKGKFIDKTSIAENATLESKWNPCPTGTFSDGTTNSCVSCPDGYTSDNGATSKEQCYKNVDPGKYLVAKEANVKDCEVGTYRENYEKVFYGNAISCDTCPTSYTSKKGAISKSKCYINCSENKYVKEVDKTCIATPAGYHKEAHTVYSGNTSTPIANTFSLKYDKNGGTGTISNTTCTYGEACTLTTSKFTPNPNDGKWEFYGWKKDNSDPLLAGGDSVKNATTTNGGTVTYYAQYRLCNRWQLVGNRDPQLKQNWEFYRGCQKKYGWIYTAEYGNNGAGVYEGPDGGLSDQKYTDWETYPPYNTSDYKKDIGRFYYINPATGYMISGWFYYNNNWYYLGSDPDKIDRTGMMYHDTTVGGQSNHLTFFGIWDKNTKLTLNKYGACTNCKNVWLRTGFIYEKTNGVVTNKRYWQYSGPDGKPYTNVTKTIGGNSYTFDSNGRCTNNNYTCDDSTIDVN